MSKNDLFALWKAEYLRPENARFMVYGEAPGKHEYFMATPFVQEDIFTALRRAGETRWDTKRRLHAENRTMGKAFPDFKPAKPLKPRTKREVALVAQAANEAFEDGLQKGRRQGEQSGAERERTRSEKFLLDVVLAQARGASK